MNIFQTHPLPSHVAKCITSIPKLLGNKCFGNYESMGTDLMIHNNNNVLCLKYIVFRKLPRLLNHLMI